VFQKTTYSRASIIMAEQEVGDYEEREDQDHYEEPSSLLEDIADAATTIDSGYVLMDVSILNELMIKQICEKCKKKITRIEQKRTGAMLSYHLFCQKEHKTVLRTQKMVEKQPEGNVAISNAVFCSGMTFSSWTRFCLAMNLLSFSSTTYYTESSESTSSLSSFALGAKQEPTPWQPSRQLQKRLFG